jgi:hypothetical protein
MPLLSLLRFHSDCPPSLRIATDLAFGPVQSWRSNSAACQSSHAYGMQQGLTVNDAPEVLLTALHSICVHDERTTILIATLIPNLRRICVTMIDASHRRGHNMPETS